LRGGGESGGEGRGGGGVRAAISRGEAGGAVVGVAGVLDAEVCADFGGGEVDELDCVGPVDPIDGNNVAVGVEIVPVVVNLAGGCWTGG
jgi:hypothetical protein